MTGHILLTDRSDTIKNINNAKAPVMTGQTSQNNPPTRRKVTALTKVSVAVNSSI